MQQQKKIIKQKILNLINKQPTILTSEIIKSLEHDTWLILESLDELKKEGHLK